ncbi:uncharacterized protein METZ01_LOCUS309085, partial [marine metagenome]
MGSFGLAQQDPKKPSILDYPKIQAAQMAGQTRAVGLMRSKRFEEAETLLRLMAEKFPQSPTTRYNLACLQAIREQVDEAFENLEKAVELGFRNIAHIKNDPDLANLRKDERFAEVLKIAGEPFDGSVWPSFPKP